jgi:hypothetical protein
MTKLKAVKTVAPSGLVMPAIHQMTFHEFAEIPSNPIQRNETLRVNKPHLQVFNYDMVVVKAVQLPDGRMYKTDGHTRVECVRQGRLLMLVDTGFLVVVTQVKDMAGVEDAYNSCDSTKAAKTPADTVQSGLRVIGFKPQTGWIASGMVGGSLTMATNHFVPFLTASTSTSSRNPKNMSHIERVDLFRKEIGLLDALSPSRTCFTQGVAAAALLAFKKHGNAATKFFRAYGTTNGLCDVGLRDDVAHLHEYMAEQRRLGHMSSTFPQNHLAMTLALFRRFLQKPNTFYVLKPSPISPGDFLK